MTIDIHLANPRGFCAGVEWLQAAGAVGVTAGASAAEVLVQQVITKLENSYATRVVQNIGHTENVSFQLPRELR